MGHSTETPNILLAQFADNDKPTWRGDVNQMNQRIDAHAGTVIGRLDALEAFDSNVEKNYRTEIPVTFFGANGNNAFDNRAAIQAAEDAASDVATTDRIGPVVIYFPAGRYKISGTIEKSPHSVWRGPGVRDITSGLEPNNAQGARIIADFDDAPAVRITGAGYPNGLNNRGAIIGMQIYSDTTVYDNNVGIECINDVREHIFDSVQVIGFKNSFVVTDCVALRFWDCYNSGALDTGLLATNMDEAWMLNTQWAGALYGADMQNCGPLNGTGNRFQSSGTANLRMRNCSSVNLRGGFIDSGSQIATGTRYGAILQDCTNTKIEGFIAYSNGPTAHVKIITTATGTTAGVVIDGMFIPGSGATATAVEIDSATGGIVSDLAIGGEFRGITPFTNIGAVTTTPTVFPSTGAPMRTANDILPTGDIVRDIGSAANRWRNLYANSYRVYAASNDAEARTILAAASLSLGAGGATAPDVVLTRGAADRLDLAAGDTFYITDGTYNGGHLRMGAYHLWFDANGILRVRNSTPSSDTFASTISTHPATSAELNSATSAVNTIMKYAGRPAFNTSTNRPMWATGNTPTATWVDADGVVVHTPA